MINVSKPIGYIEFNDHREDILKMKCVNGVTNVYEVITNDGFYIHDCSKQDGGPGNLYRQTVTEGDFPQTIKSQLHVCEFKNFVLYRCIV